MVDNLEYKVKKYESILNFKAYLVDTSARIIFYVPPIALWEKYVSGMENEEVLKSRMSAIMINFIFGRLHGKVREYVSKLTDTHENDSKTRQFVADTLSGFIIGGTSYSIVLGIAGVSLEEALIAMPFAIGLTTFTGRPFGKYLDWYRNVFSMTSVYKNKIKLL